MEYTDLVSRIIAAEHSAKEIAQQAVVQKSTLEEDLVRDESELRESYFARANRRIALVEETESQAAAEHAALWDKKLADAMAAVENSYAKNKEAWVDALFSMIVGGQK